MPEDIAPDARAKAGKTAAVARADSPEASQAQRLARKTRSLDLLYEVATSLSRPGSLEQVLEGFLDTLLRLVDARGGRVRLAAEDGGMRVAAARGAAAPEGATLASIPVQHQDRVLGACELLLDRPLAQMDEDMPELLASVGRHLGLAIEKARLEGEARRLAIVEERNIIGNELHDSLAQSLVGMRLQLKMLTEALGRGDAAAAHYEAGGLRRSIAQAEADLRSLLTSYRLKIAEAGLGRAVADLVERFRAETGIAVFFQNECRALALAPAQEIQVFFIIQEALVNIRRHSGARNVRILLNNEDDLYTVLIEDDGLGMAGPEAPLPAEHAGLAIMRERTQRLPGQFVIESEPGEGTRIVLIFNAPAHGATQA